MTGITFLVTSVRGGRILDPEVQHRLRARAGGRIRCLKDTGLRDLPLHNFAAPAARTAPAQHVGDLGHRTVPDDQ